jgi:hypothetical protein
MSMAAIPAATLTITRSIQFGWLLAVTLAQSGRLAGTFGALCSEAWAEAR